MLLDDILGTQTAVRFASKVRQPQSPNVVNSACQATLLAKSPDVTCRVSAAVTFCDNGLQGRLAHELVDL